MALHWLLPLLACAAQLTSAFYLPGVSPKSYKYDEPVPLQVNSITPLSSHSGMPIRSLVSYEYYHPAFKFCRPKVIQTSSESLGSILFGDRIMNSPFELRMNVTEECKTLCTQSYGPNAIKFMRKAVEDDYSFIWLVDLLPAGSEWKDPRTDVHYYSPGFPLGYAKDGVQYLHNHYDIVIQYHEVNGDTEQRRVVGATVRPASIHYPGPSADCGLGHGISHKAIGLTQGLEKLDVTYSYGVYWEKSNVVWATRWDKYLHDFYPNIHWFWLIDIAVLVVVLVLTVMSILVRTLKRDISRYNRLDEINLDDLTGTSAVDDGIQEDSGWKLVHGDVFRPPTHPLLLSLLVGNGSQLFVMAGLTVLFAMLGFLSPSNRGALGSIMVLSYTFLGSIGGYISARSYKAWQGEKWKLNMFLTPVVVPVIIFGTFFFLNLFLWANESSGAVPFTTMLVIILLWFGFSIPLSFLGAWLGFKAPTIAASARTNQIPRQIPRGPTYLRRIPSMLIVGLLPFLAIIIELLFIMRSIWFSRIYYMFGFFFLSYALMVVTSAAVTIIFTYLLLCSENYNWQWRAFLAAGTSGIYFFVNCLFYLVSKMHLAGMTSITLYLGYSALLSFLFMILNGAVGYLSSWWFVKRIYASLKVD